MSYMVIHTSQGRKIVPRSPQRVIRKIKSPQSVVISAMINAAGVVNKHKSQEKRIICK